MVSWHPEQCKLEFNTHDVLSGGVGGVQEEEEDVVGGSGPLELVLICDRLDRGSSWSAE